VVAPSALLFAADAGSVASFGFEDAGVAGVGDGSVGAEPAAPGSNHTEGMGGRGYETKMLSQWNV